MVYLDAINKLIHDAYLDSDEALTLKMFTDSLAWNKCNVLPDKISSACMSVIRKIEEKGLLNRLNDIIASPKDFDNTDLDDDVAGIH